MELITQSEAAKRLGVTQEAICNRLQRGMLKGHIVHVPVVHVDWDEVLERQKGREEAS